MPEKKHILWGQASERATQIVNQIRAKFGSINCISVYGIPNGGITAALLVEAMAAKQGFEILQAAHRSRADVYIDDILDSGRTAKKFSDKPFYALVDKQKENIQDVWVVFPWEAMAKVDGPEDNITRILQYIGEDPERPGLLETPKRVTKSYEELFAGYKQNPEDYVKVFEETASDAMVILKDVEFYSHCEHHMAPFFGKADLAYIPNFTTEQNKDGSIFKKYRVLGASKLSRVFDCFARRLQIQERIGAQFTEFLMKSSLNPRGVGCRIEATHFCMCSRGINKQHSKMITSSIQGVFHALEVRNEFLSLIRS
jgi:GTP cyclohydrolase I